MAPEGLDVVHQGLLKLINEDGSRGVERLHDDHTSFQSMFPDDFVEVARDVDEIEALARLVEQRFEIEMNSGSSAPF